MHTTPGQRTATCPVPLGRFGNLRDSLVRAFSTRPATTPRPLCTRVCGCQGLSSNCRSAVG